MSTPDPNPPADAARPRIGTACAVVAGCGLAGLVAVGVLIYLAVTLFNQIGGDNQDGGGSGKRGPRPGPVLPTQLAKDQDTIKLPGLFDGVCRAAGGRYLILRIPDAKEKQLAVFDPNTASIVKSLPLAEPDSLFAATAAKLFVYRPRTHRLERYDLVSWERERTAPKPDGLTSVDALLAGPGSDGPVLLVGRRSPTSADVMAVEPDRMAAGTVRETDWRTGPARASHDGRLVGAAAAGVRGIPSGAVLLRFGPGETVEPRPLRVGGGVGHAAPSPDGRWVYTAVGVFDSDGSQTLQPTGGYFYTLPTAHGSDLFVSLSVDTEGMEPVFRTPMRLHLANDARTIADLRGKPPSGVHPQPGPGQVPADLRVHLWPAAGLVAVLPTTNDRIELYKVDVAKLLKESGKEYLLIGSDPPTAAVRGATWSYQPVVWSSADGGAGVEVKGPPGMVRSEKRTVVWPVPADFTEPDVQVQVKVTDSAGRTAEQTFRVVLTEG
jgi:hypothetical protein